MGTKLEILERRGDALFKLHLEIKELQLCPYSYVLLTKHRAACRFLLYGIAARLGPSPASDLL